jgi:hypothetical protein
MELTIASYPMKYVPQYHDHELTNTSDILYNPQSIAPSTHIPVNNACTFPSINQKGKGREKREKRLDMP